MDEYFPIPPFVANFGESYAWWKDGFSVDELAKLTGQLDAMPLETATTVGATEGVGLTDIRRSKVGWVQANEDTIWFYKRIAEIVANVNKDWFGFDLSGMFKLQYTVYEEEQGGHYDWHVDMMGRGCIQRKLSFVMMLSDAMDYEGGELWIHNHSRLVADKTKGMIHFFPSYCLHRVTPVTKGVRKTLVGWCVGPNFR